MRGCALIAVSPVLGVYIVGACLTGAGHSVCESLSSAALSDLGETEGMRYINLSQGLLSVGAFISPILLRQLILHLDAQWRTLFIICAAAFWTNINAASLQLRKAGRYGHNYVIDDNNGSICRAAQVLSLNSGIAMTVETSQPAIQFYTAKPYPVCRGKEHAEYRPQGSFCPETQGFPDAPNHPDLLSTILCPGEQYSHISRFVFTRSL